MPVADERSKTGLRNKYKQIRDLIPRDKKAEYDRLIYRRVIGLRQYEQCRLLLTYASVGTEVSTREIIEHALRGGKKVAVPRCVGDTIRFYFINDINELSMCSFGILEPVPDCKPVTSCEQGLCIVPALCYDLDGYRLGYGKGYYDRFLSAYHSAAIGLAYSDCVIQRLPREEHDRRVGLIVTQDYTVSIPL